VFNTALLFVTAKEQARVLQPADKLTISLIEAHLSSLHGRNLCRIAKQKLNPQPKVLFKAMLISTSPSCPWMQAHRHPGRVRHRLHHHHHQQQQPSRLHQA
jgi:hypothetical protein